MSEPAEDTAIEITPKTETQSGRVPKIVAEIAFANRVGLEARAKRDLLHQYQMRVLRPSFRSA